MKRFYVIGVLAVLMLTITAPIQADQWVDVGPASMPLSELKVLQQMVEGDTLASEMALCPKPDLVNVGMASLPRAEFLMLSGLVSGEVKVDKNSGSPKEALIDLGIVTIKQTEMQALSRMVQRGLLQHWNADPQLDIAAQ